MKAEGGSCEGSSERDVLRRAEPELDLPRPLITRNGAPKSLPPSAFMQKKRSNSDASASQSRQSLLREQVDAIGEGFEDSGLGAGDVDAHFHGRAGVGL